MIDRKKSPAIYDAVEFDLKLKPCEKYTLDNGVPVYAVNAGEQDVVMVEFVFFAGNWYENQNILAASTNFLLKNGTQHKTALEVNEHFEFHGAYLNRHCYNETATVTLHCLSKHLPQLLPAIAEVLTESVFPEEELAIYKQNQKQRLEVSLKKCDFVANRLIDDYLYGIEHPYGKYTTAPDYDAVEREQLLAFYQQYYTKGKCVVFTAGKLPADIQQQLNSAFGHLPFNQQEIPEVTHAVKPAVEKKYNIINDASGVQGAIRIAQPFPNRHHPDFIKAQVLNNVFGGFFGSRLMSNIREDKGYTYGIHSYLQNHIHQSAWMISTEAGRDVCAATIEEVYKEMQRLRDEPIEKDELDLVRNYMMGSILGDLDGPFQIISRWKNYVLNNLTESYFYNNLQTIRTISAEELQALAQKYLQPEAFYELTVV
ncbi:Predicted Zn-dependent peptidase [Filimonas lacunae]|uniref:Predicted Zn-dependent peptidase n=1 Tax=Filimonas lacunae TaxID=477680 RepID=A0A173MQF7_9BACT|nr:pitrilysin family protein [Filimonas lacunae]BAV09611.1 zinc protease [Filimonas lacunae]SIS75905.1 Predicted Zn-dependent peptidase [Filimonas lacunae]